MKLESQGMTPLGEGLMRITVTRCEVRGAIRQIERLAVPMQYLDAVFGTGVA